MAAPHCLPAHRTRKRVVRAHVQFFCCMSLRLYRQTLYFVVMENVFMTTATVHERFDLKGSWVGRAAAKARGGGGACVYVMGVLDCASSPGRVCVCDRA